MNNLKISGQQFTRGVNSNQRAEKQRDESFIASSLVDNKKASTTENKDLQTNKPQTVAEDRTMVLVEQRKQEMAQQQLDKSQELSMQRQIEERSAVNRQRLKASYAEVQQNDNQKQAQELKAKQNQEVRQEQNNTLDAINLVV